MSNSSSSDAPLCTNSSAEHRPQPKIVQHFLAHQGAWAIGLLLLYIVSHILLNSTNEIMEHQRSGDALAAWQPFTWEISSAIFILILFPCVVLITDRWISHRRIGIQLLMHLALTLPFCLIHVVGMVAVRKAVYVLAGDHYDFGHWNFEFWYEYRKDFSSYTSILLSTRIFRFIAMRLQGEASILAKSETPAAQSTAQEFLLVRKFGKEFLVRIDEIEWVEASGNYANLHVGQRIYPMRTTMAELEKQLPSDRFARVHRSSIVNIEFVDNLTAQDSGDYSIQLKNAKELSLSRRYRESFKQQFSLMSPA